jgi:hypothetical protein
VDDVALDKKPQSLEESTAVEVDVEVYTDNHNTFQVRLGNVDRGQLKTLHETIRMSFETLSPTRGLTFVDQSGVTRHFNTAHITCIQVNIR